MVAQQILDVKDQPSVNQFVVDKLVEMDGDIKDVKEEQKCLRNENAELRGEQVKQGKKLIKVEEKAINNGKLIGWIMGVISAIIVGVAVAILSDKQFNWFGGYIVSSIKSLINTVGCLFG